MRNLQRRVKVDTRALGAFLRTVAAELDADSYAATLALVDDRRMTTLQREFRDKDRPTDVLSFPGGGEVGPDGEAYLGDIVISVDTAGRQAARRRSSLPRELRVLALHGFLHLLGYDHEVDRGEMRRVEYRLRRKLGITRPREAVE